MTHQTLDPSTVPPSRTGLELCLENPRAVRLEAPDGGFLGFPAEALADPTPELLSPASWKILHDVLPRLAPGSEHPLRVRDAEGRARVVTLRAGTGPRGQLLPHAPEGFEEHDEDLLDRALDTAQDDWGEVQVEALARRGEDLQRILYHSPGIQLILAPGPPLRFVFVSDNIDRLGHRAEHLVAGKVHTRQLFHADDHDRVLDEIACRCDDPDCSDFRIEFRWLAIDGTTRWMDTHLWIQRDPSGHAHELQGIAWDITERKRAESQHRIAVGTVELLNCSTDTLEVLHHILEMLYEHAELDGVAISIRRPNGGLEHDRIGFEGTPPLDIDSCGLCRSVLGDTTDAPCPCGFAAEVTRPAVLRRTAAGSLWTNSAAVIFECCRKQEHLDRSTPIRDGSLALVPLRASGEVLGMMQLRSARCDAFEETDIEFFESLGSSLGIALDRETAVRRLRASEERYRGLFDTSREGIVIRTLDGHIEDANHAYLHMVGRSLKEIQGLPAWSYLRRPESVEAGVCYPGQLLSDGFTHDQEFEIVRPDGSVILVMSRSWLMNDERGAPLRELSILRDITQSRQAEQERRRLVAAVTQSDEMVVITDLAGRIQYVNPAFERTTGYTREEALGQPVSILSSGRHPREFYRELWETIARGETWQGRFINQRKDGTIYHEDATISCVRNELGRITNYVAVKRDVTQLVQLEADLLQAQKLESIGRLAAGIAHEINTPSQYVGDNIRFLQENYEDISGVLRASRDLVEHMGTDEPLDESLANLARRVERADLEYLLEEIPSAISQSLEGIGRVTTIVTAMKNFSHPGTGELTPIDVNKAIESTTTVSRNEWKYVADLHLDLDPSLPLVPCLPNEFNQVILNMVVNAAHAIEAQQQGEGEKGQITVRTALDGEAAVIEIEDTGSGIPEEVRDRIFDPFFTTKDVGRGTGQGLSIAHDIIVDKHQGSISFETEMGVGTTFTIRLPIQQESTSPSDPREDGGRDEGVPVFADADSDGDDEVIG